MFKATKLFQAVLLAVAFTVAFGNPSQAFGQDKDDDDRGQHLFDMVADELGDLQDQVSNLADKLDKCKCDVAAEQKKPPTKKKSAPAGPTVSQRLTELETYDIPNILSRLKAVEDKLAGIGPSPPPGVSQEAFDRLQSQANRLDGEVEKLRGADGLSGLKDQVDGLSKRVDKLKVRPNRFDAGAFGLVAHGFYAVGAEFGALWPFGDEGSWVFRLAGGAGQGWINFEDDVLMAPALTVEADMLYQLSDDVRIGPCVVGIGGIGGTEGSPFSFLYYGAGAAFRWQMAHWAAFQLNAGPGVALNSFNRELPNDPGDAFREVVKTWSAAGKLVFIFP